VLVYQSGRAARGALKRAKEQLVNVGAHVGGVVLNNISASEMKPAASYYYYERES
jgi:Mrp family chromosome partitioning ATPase